MPPSNLRCLWLVAVVASSGIYETNWCCSVKSGADAVTTCKQSYRLSLFSCFFFIKKFILPLGKFMIERVERNLVLGMQGPLRPRTSILDLELESYSTRHGVMVWTDCYGRSLRASVCPSVTMSQGTNRCSRFHVYVAARHAHRLPGTQILIGRYCVLGSRLGSITPMEELCESVQLYSSTLCLVRLAAGITIPIPSELT
jgi:hypothetical protein